MKRVALLGAVSALLLAACQPGSSDTIKIGYIGPLTGDAAALGVDILGGVRMAVADINTAGGINGKTVELIAEDGKCASSDATSAAQKLVNIDKVVAVLGGQCSGETLAAAPVADPAKIVMISGISSNPTVTDAGDYVFRVYPSDALKTKAMAAYFKQKGYTKVGLVTENNDFATGFRASLLKDVPTGTIVFDETVDQGEKDFRTLFTRLKDTDMDAMVMNAGSNAVMGQMMKQFREAGFEQPIVSHDVADTTDVLTTVGSAGRNIFVINVPNAGEGTSFEEDFITQFGTPKAGITYAAYGADSAVVLFNALKQADSGEALQKAVAATKNFKGLVGTIGFDANGDVVGIPYALKQYQSGAIVKVSDIAVD